jgi:4-hydroxy-tetrahydrodipicolinate synthase
MVLEGSPEYELHFNPTDTLSASQKHYAATQLALFKSWYRSWSGAGAGAGPAVT